MTEYDNTNTGTLWPNKPGGAAPSDSGGKIDIEGREHYIDAWISADRKTQRLEIRYTGTREPVSHGEMTRQEKKTEKYPDWKGTLEDLDGNTWSIAGWRRTTKAKGKPFLSLKLEAMESREPGDDGDEGDDEEVPF